MYANRQPCLVAVFVAALVAVSALSACGDKKEAEDVARIRMLMDKQEAEKKAAVEKSKAKFAAMRKNAENSASSAN